MGREVSSVLLRRVRRANNEKDEWPELSAALLSLERGRERKRGRKLEHKLAEAQSHLHMKMW